MRSLAAALLFLIAAALVLAACGSGRPNLLIQQFDGGADGAVDGAAPSDAPFASDADSEFGGPCLDDGQCDDAIACTFDQCDLVRKRCKNVPDDTRCADGTYCNGREVCVRGRGCAEGPVVTCGDGNACTIDRCIEASESCVHDPRDADGDGDPDDRCATKRDCDDTDPTVASTRSEVCGNRKDDDCDGTVDELSCSNAAGDRCDAPIALVAGATTRVSTVAAKKDYPTTCGVTTPGAASDVVGTIVVPAGPPRDVEVWVTSSTSEVAVAMQGTCGDAATELACGSGGSVVRTRARSLAPGTYAVVVTSQNESDVEVKVALLDATSRPTNETCANAAPIVPDVPLTVSIVDPAKDLASSCSAGMGELTYTFTLAQPADVKIFSSTLLGSGQPVIGLRGAGCAGASDELRCRTSSALPLFARGLDAGTYYVTVAASSPIDASVQLKTYPPSTPPLDQSCATATPVVINGTFGVSLADHEDAIKDGCFAGGPTAAYALTLGAPSDVMLVGRFPSNEAGAVSMGPPACTVDARLLCRTGSSPVRVNKRSVPAGEYRVVLTDSLGENATLTTLVRDAVAPTVVPSVQSDRCATPFDIPTVGGFFTGDTSTATSDFDNGCDAAGLAPGGAKDQILRLALTERRRVVLNMDGSTFATILDVREGSTCPGQPIGGGCFVGFGGARSFLDFVLDAGTYYLIIDGFNNATGPWNLDVRVVAP